MAENWIAWHQPPHGLWHPVATGTSWLSARAAVAHLERLPGHLVAILRPGADPGEGCERYVACTRGRAPSSLVPRARLLLPYLDRPRTARELMVLAGLSRECIRRRLLVLRHAGLVRQTAAVRGAPWVAVPEAATTS